MNAFESLVAAILQSKGFWTISNFKVELSKQEKVELGRPTMPRWELDLVAYKPLENRLIVVECKSYLDSTGVDPRAIFTEGHRYAKRYKLFTEDKARRVVFNALANQLLAKGLLVGPTEPRLCLAAGRITRAGKDQLCEEFRSRGWELYDLDWIRQGLDAIAVDGYENNMVSILAKLLKPETP